MIPHHLDSQKKEVHTEVRYPKQRVFMGGCEGGGELSQGVHFLLIPVACLPGISRFPKIKVHVDRKRNTVIYSKQCTAPNATANTNDSTVLLCPSFGSMCTNNPPTGACMQRCYVFRTTYRKTQHQQHALTSRAEPSFPRVHARQFNETKCRAFACGQWVLCTLPEFYNP